MKHAIPGKGPRRVGYTDDDLQAYAFHLWIQSGMGSVGDSWEEAKACLECNRPPGVRDARPGGARQGRW